MQALTPAQQRANRLHLADMIEHRVTNKQFNMRRWSNECGTVGCALGIAALSGEIDGLGWNTDRSWIPNGVLRPVVDGAFQDWADVGASFFGKSAHSRVFLGMFNVGGPTARKEVADALRAIED